MKKITTLALLPIIALISCSKNQDNIEFNSNSKTNLSNKNESKEIELTKTDQTLNTNINSGNTDNNGIITKNFNLTYNLPDGRPLQFNGNLTIKNGKIDSVNFPEYDLINGKSYEIEFAKKLKNDIVGKEINGLQYDGMSGASLTTNSFNDFLNTINK